MKEAVLFEKTETGYSAHVPVPAPPTIAEYIIAA
jgi:hypothetical protein